ncbi:MAG TPA: hypothetical protein PLN26_02010 [Acidobacteriota bacterium]|nr:hypothetical protein [Acidobacteriota bacterium]HQF85976.1 hypothetical protein [Acidobacteriota bacterium]HQG90781.1 hypothetical protein [Acidobacteriota bacterium]HQK86694.1 hypothetical protein [Acidobacteriota bacterium]
MAGQPDRGRLALAWICIVLGAVVLGFMAVQYLSLAFVGGMLMPEIGVLAWLQGFSVALVSVPGIVATLVLFLGLVLLVRAHR